MLIDAARPSPDEAMVEELRARLKLPNGFGDDAALADSLTAPLQLGLHLIEARTARALLRRGFVLRDGAVDPAGRLVLPREPVRAVTEVALERGDGGREVLPASRWWLTSDRGRAVIALQIGALDPSTFVEVAFEAGYADDWEDVPPDLRAAVIEVAADRFDGVAVSAGALSRSAAALLEPYRRIRL